MNPFAVGAIASAALTVIGVVAMWFGGVVKPSTGIPWLVIAVLTGVSVVLWLVILFRRRTGGDARGTFFLGFLLAAPVFGALLWAGHGASKHVRGKELAAAGIDVKLADYLAERPLVEQTGEPKGKLVVVDMDDKDFSDVHFQLPADMKPASAAEVGTVVQVTMTQRVVGSYTNGGDAKQWVAQVRLIDLAKNVAWHQSEVPGSQPPQSTKSKGGASGSKPDKQLVEHIQRFRGGT